MKISVNDLSKIASTAQAEGILEFDLQEGKMVGEVVAGDTKTILTVEPVLKGDQSAGVRVSKNVFTKTTLIDDSSGK